MVCRRVGLRITSAEATKGEEAMSEVSDVPCARVQQETAAYIRDMAIELAAMARAARCDTLCSVLEMAEMEAGSLLDGDSPSSAHSSSNGAGDAA
jgi:hypothetical protein